MTTRPNPNPWLPLSTAPRDGTVVELTDSPDGEVWPMRYELFRNREGGIWAMWGFSGSLLSTWSEDDPDFPPRLWRLVKARAADVKVAA